MISRKSDLEDDIRGQYRVVRDFEFKVSHASSEKERQRYQRELEVASEDLSEIVRRYLRLLERKGEAPPKEISELIDSFAAGKAPEVEEDIPEAPVSKSAESRRNVPSAIRVTIARVEDTIVGLLDKLKARRIRELTVAEGSLLVGCGGLIVSALLLYIAVTGQLSPVSSPEQLTQSSTAPPSPSDPTQPHTTELPSESRTPTQDPTSDDPSPFPSFSNDVAVSCIRAASDSWYATWLPGDEPDPDSPMSRDPDKFPCYDFAMEGFSASTGSGSTGPSLRVSCGIEGSTCTGETKTRALFIPLNPGDTSLTVTIDRIEIRETIDQAPSDVDFFIGAGDPLEGTGRFIVFRLINPTGQIHFCAQSALDRHCNVVTRVSPDDFGSRSVVVSHSPNGNTRLLVEGVGIGSASELADLGIADLWVGYRIRTEGLIDAKVEFPPSFTEHLTLH